MADLLIVASPVTSPLCTDQPIPTEGLTEWTRCVVCSTRYRRSPDVPRPCLQDHDAFASEPDGPFPFTVARWAEVKCRDSCCTDLGGGAITHLVEVTGPSHHADKCMDTDLVEFHPLTYRASFCADDAAPDCWHTPTGKVTPLVEPIPVERPEKWRPCPHDDACRNERRGSLGYRPHDHYVSASVWSASDDVADRLREVMA